MIGSKNQCFTEDNISNTRNNSEGNVSTVDTQSNSKVFKRPPHLPENASEFRIFVYEVTESKPFGGAILFVIILNTVVLVAQTSEEISFKGDFIIVLCTTVDFLLPLIVQNVAGFDVAAIFRLLRMFRAIRALRALRVLRTISREDMFAVVGRGLFYGVAPNRFGTLGRAFITLFQLITLDDWYYVYSEVIKKEPGHAFIIMYLILYIVLENFIFMNLFVAVLVDNFQRAFTEAEGGRRRKDNSNSNKQRTLFRVELEDNDNSEDGFFSETSSEEEDEEGNTSHKHHHRHHHHNHEEVTLKDIEEYYPFPKYSKKEQELLQEHFTLLGMLEFNVHQSKIQQKLLDDLVDIAITVSIILLNICHI
eukprot:gene19791-21730_t